MSLYVIRCNGLIWKSLIYFVSTCVPAPLCAFLSTHINHGQGPSRFFRVFHNRVQRRRGIFWLNLHVKWSMLFCGCEVPPDSPSPVTCQTEPASSPHSSPPAEVGHDSAVRNILRSCQSLRCPTKVSLLKSSRLARTNTANSQGLSTRSHIKSRRKHTNKIGSHGAARRDRDVPRSV